MKKALTKALTVKLIRNKISTHIMFLFSITNQLSFQKDDHCFKLFRRHNIQRNHIRYVARSVIPFLKFFYKDLTEAFKHFGLV